MTKDKAETAPKPKGKLKKLLFIGVGALVLIGAVAAVQSAKLTVSASARSTWIAGTPSARIRSRKLRPNWTATPSSAG